jgi:hypothetical protein
MLSDMVKRVLGASVYCVLAISLISCSDASTTQTSTPTFPPAEQAVLNSLHGACNDDPHSDGDLDAKARVALQDIGEKTPLGPNEDVTELLRFLRNSIPASAEPMGCSEILAIYSVQRQRGSITAP